MLGCHLVLGFHLNCYYFCLVLTEEARWRSKRSDICTTTLLCQSTIKWHSFEFFAKLVKSAFYLGAILHLCDCQIFPFNILRNMGLRQQSVGKFSLHEHFLYNIRAIENVILPFSDIWFFQAFKITFAKSFYLKNTLFYDRFLKFF